MSPECPSTWGRQPHSSSPSPAVCVASMPALGMGGKRPVKGQLLLPSRNADPVLATVTHRMSTRPPSQRSDHGIKGGWGGGEKQTKSRMRTSKSFKSRSTLILRFYFSNLDLETTTCVRQPPALPLPAGPSATPYPPPRPAAGPPRLAICLNPAAPRQLLPRTLAVRIAPQRSCTRRSY